MSYEVRLSNRAAKDLDRMDRDARERVLNRLSQLAEAPRDPRLSTALASRGGLRNSRVGGWRIILTLDEDSKTVYVVTVERRGQVYQRI